MTELHHVALGARDVAGVARFYQLAFGLAVERQHHYPDGRLRSIWLGAGPVRLMIEHTEAPERSVEGVGRGPFLLAFSITESERAVVEGRLATLGAPIEERTECSSYARDPEGNRVAVSYFPKA